MSHNLSYDVPADKCSEAGYAKRVNDTESRLLRFANLPMRQGVFFFWEENQKRLCFILGMVILIGDEASVFEELVSSRLGWLNYDQS